MATYNGAKFLEAQLESILSQLRDEDELIISDDGSDDGTLAILRELKGHNISVFENHFRNPVLNFQFTLERSR
ncbi:MAG: glycosyltransferase, partial [Owenweeksia sp.]